MGKYRLVVLTEPVTGRESEYNDWYNNQHLADVVAVPGFGGAQRFKLKELCGGEFRQRYLAIYEIEAEDYAAVIGEMMSRVGTPAMLISEAMDGGKVDFGVFEECSQRIESPAKQRPLIVQPGSSGCSVEGNASSRGPAP